MHENPFGACPPASLPYWHVLRHELKVMDIVTPFVSFLGNLDLGDISALLQSN